MWEKSKVQRGMVRLAHGGLLNNKPSSYDMHTFETSGANVQNGVEISGDIRSNFETRGMNAISADLAFDGWGTCSHLLFVVPFSP